MDTAVWVCGTSEPPQAACKAASSGSVPAGPRGCGRLRGVAVVLLLAAGGVSRYSTNASTRPDTANFNRKDLIGREPGDVCGHGSWKHLVEARTTAP